MKPSRIGIYNLGPMKVRLELIDGYGGSFSTNVETPGSPLPFIRVGYGEGRWGRVVECLLHEAFEFAAFHCGCRFLPSPDYGGEQSGYTFVIQHVHFSEISARAGMFMADSLPDLAHEFNRWRKIANARPPHRPKHRRKRKK
jgi:hypothetical protein